MHPLQKLSKLIVSNCFHITFSETKCSHKETDFYFCYKQCGTWFCRICQKQVYRQSNGSIRYGHHPKCDFQRN
jgi:hypothetical protein